MIDNKRIAMLDLFMADRTNEKNCRELQRIIREEDWDDDKPFRLALADAIEEIWADAEYEQISKAY